MRLWRNLRPGPLPVQGEWLVYVPLAVCAAMIGLALTGWLDDTGTRLDAMSVLDVEFLIRFNGGGS